jgi:hypothetical protein
LIGINNLAIKDVSVRKMILLNKKLKPVILLILAFPILNCAVATKIQSPLPIKNFDSSNGESVMLHIPEASRTYIWKGEINIIDYSVEFGNGLEPNAKYALSKYYKDVTVIDSVILPAKSTGNNATTITIEIEKAFVNPGSLTFMPTQSQIKTKALLSKGGKPEGEEISVVGMGSASPGILGLIPLVNQIVYDNALQYASEQAMTNALEKIIDEIIKRKGKK